MAATSPGTGWVANTTKGPDCDDTNVLIPLVLSCLYATVQPPEGNKDCEKRTGYLHDANFTNKTPTLGNNTTIAEDNFRNDSWGIINETNCGNGKIPKGSTVNVLSTAAVTRQGTTLKYYKVEYDECMESNKERLNCGGDPCKVTSNFGTNAKSESVNKCSLEKIKEIANRLSINKFKITSTSRTAEDQARIMYDNIVTYGVTKQKSLYGSNGDKVIDAYTAALNANKTKEQTKQAMLDKINEIGANNVSNHAADSNTLTVIDIAPSSMSSTQRTKFVEAINRAIANGDVSRFLHPGNSKDPAYHIEIKVKNCELKNCI